MTDDQRGDRELIREALTKLLEFNENEKPLSLALGGLIGCAYAAAENGMTEGEALEGAIICMMGARGSQTTEMVGALNPVWAYGSLIDAIFEVRTAAEMDHTQAAIKSFVGNAQVALASIEKEITKPDEH